MPATLHGGTRLDFHGRDLPGGPPQAGEAHGLERLRMLLDGIWGEKTFPIAFFVRLTTPPGLCHILRWPVIHLLLGCNGDGRLAPCTLRHCNYFYGERCLSDGGYCAVKRRKGRVN